MPVTVIIRNQMTPRLVADVRGAVGAAVQDTAVQIARRAQQKIKDPPKTGRIYTGLVRFGSGRLVQFGQAGPGRPYPHQASAPGEAPADWSGELRRSIKATMVGPARALVTVGAAYGGKYLENGSPGGKIAPRPFLRPSVEEQRPLFAATVRDAVWAALQRVGQSDAQAALKALHAETSAAIKSAAGRVRR